MDILNTNSLESNKKIKINFDGGDLSSDAGLLLLKEFICKIGLDKLFEQHFKTNDKAVRIHKDHENLLQKIYQKLAGYFTDDDSDELTTDPVFTILYSVVTRLEIAKLCSIVMDKDENAFVTINDVSDVMGGKHKKRAIH